MRSILTILAASFIVANAAAGDGGKWSVDDVLFSESAAEFELSPDGRWAIWVKSVMDAEKGEVVSNLMRTGLTQYQSIALTRGIEEAHAPHWSPDGKLIAFLSDRPASRTGEGRGRAAKAGRGRDSGRMKAQIWLINPFGGEPWPLTSYSRAISGFSWAGPEQIVFAAQEEETLHEKTTNDRNDMSEVVEDELHEPPVRLFRLDVKSKKITRLTKNSDRIGWMAVSPDGKWAVAQHLGPLRSDYDSRIKPLILLHDLADGTSRKVFADPKYNVGAVRWRLDSKGFYATNEFSSNNESAYPAITEVYHVDLAMRTETKIDLGWPNGLALQDANNSEASLVVAADGFLALLANGARHKPARFIWNDGAWRRQWLEGEHTANIFGYAVARDGKSLVYAHSTAGSPVQWHHAFLDGNRLGKPAPIASINESLQGRAKPRTEIIRWKGARHEDVEGVLLYPHDYDPKKQYPLVVMIHGGPNTADLDCWDETVAYAPNLYCQREAFVLRPNYHGSSNYGLKWLESIKGGRYGGLEIADIEKGVDRLIEKGLVDKNKLGVLGWSNGAILANELTARTTRYKAAAIVAGEVDWVSDWANCEFGESFNRAYLGASPLQNRALYLRKSVFYRLDKVRTPTLIFFGSEDRTVSTEQGWMHYRALQQLGKTEVRFILFPGEKHGLTKLAHQRRKLREELDWFDKYLFNTPNVENEALKADSPLSRALKLRTVSRDRDCYGAPCKGKLIPETVTFAGKQLGRFEVTRAQYRSFDPNYAVERSGENYPASGLSLDDAQRYCQWLSQLTGDAYRLPAENEAEQLYTSDSVGENTLDYWAGYAVNPDDAKKLRPKIEELHVGPKAPLLTEVGRFRMTGDAGVFDLGGNVAEWVMTVDGRGMLKGGSADCPADAKSPRCNAGPEYRGFRVVREERKK